MAAVNAIEVADRERTSRSAVFAREVSNDSYRFHVRHKFTIL